MVTERKLTPLGELLPAARFICLVVPVRGSNGGANNGANDRQYHKERENCASQNKYFRDSSIKHHELLLKGQ